MERMVRKSARMILKAIAVSAAAIPMMKRV
jgi:hypothetical protein